MSSFYSLKIKMDHVICRDTESLHGRDNFALMGGVIVDGTWVPFVFDPISITPTMGRESWPNGIVFHGSMRNREIGLVLVGYDIDNNSAWKREREEITKTMDTMAKGVGFVPGIGKVAAAILSAWPRVVDGFVALDKNDLLLEHSEAITLPDVSWTSEAVTAHQVEVRFKGANPPIYSDWDYSLHISFAYRNEYKPSFGGHRPEHTRHAHKSSNANEWVGTWVSERVRCEIARSSRGADLLDVRLTESGSGASLLIDDLAIPITQPIDNRILEQGPALKSLLGDAKGGAGKLPSKGKPSVTGKPVKAMGRRSVADRNVGLTMNQGNLTMNNLGLTKDKVDMTMKVPQREFTGADRLMLSNDAALEIYALRDRGQPTRIRELRYVRPYSKPSFVATLQVDEYLKWQILA